MITAFASVSAPRETLHRQRRGDLPSGGRSGPSSQSKEKTKGANERRCYNCNEFGHLMGNCPWLKRKRGTCFRCGNFGHRASQCQQTEEQINYVAITQEEDNNNFLREVELRISKEKNNLSMRLEALLDSGSPICFLKDRFVPRECMFTNVDSNRYCGINSSGLEVTGCVNAILVFGDKEYEITLRVVPDKTMRSALVIGRDFMLVAKLFLSEEKEIADIMCIEVDRDNDSGSSQEMEINEDLPSDIKALACEIFNRCYIKAQRPSSPAVENTMKLMLRDDKPFSCAPRRLSYSEKDVLMNILRELLDKGVIRESTSEYASPIVLTKKKNGQVRLCVDFRRLNKVTLRDNFPLSLIEDQLDLLSRKKYFTTLDLKNGFFHIRMEEGSIKYTSFVTLMGQYEYLRMPFGLKGAPLRFQRYVTEIFREHIHTGEVSVYLDDFLVAAETMEHHLWLLERVFKLLVANKLELRLDKCRFFQTKIDCLGYTVMCDGIKPMGQRLDAVKRFPIPRDIRDVQSFLGLCSYFRKFVENFSVIAKPLYDLTRRDVKFQFGDVEEQAFTKLKEKLMHLPVLSIYSLRDETELHCDASSIGFGAILMQRKSDYLANILQDTFKEVPVYELYRRTFRNRKQRENESTSSFLYTLETMCNNCNFGRLREAAIQIQFCNGLRNELIQSVLWRLQELNAEEMLDIAKEMELHDRYEAMGIHYPYPDIVYNVLN
ncbi:uncharacterized protein LOC122525712 [Polistes fuscatus]|uniref:uncharacterized protein LOC122525712 n=1 Tax=Polistes fuscatus TaxID=30207 RepID=UPI001CA8BC9F|nr:uncharacterized protein LOC122525712 [Polistes fuscatus]